MKYLTTTPAPITHNDDAYVNSVNDTLHTIDFAEVPLPNNPNCVSCSDAASDAHGNEAVDDVSSGSAAGIEVYSESPALSNVMESKAENDKPNITYNSFTFPQKELQNDNVKSVELADCPQPFIQVDESHQSKYDPPTEAEPRGRRVTQNGTERLRNRRGTLSFKSRNLVIDIRSSDGMYVGKIRIKVRQHITCFLYC